MARRATGQIIEPNGARKSWALRVPYKGERHYVRLGRDGWDRERAERELRHVMADIERGIWRPPNPEPQPKVDPTFHEFAEEWFERHRPEWKDSTATDYQWALEHHMLPYFAGHRLGEITVEEVDRFRAAKLREGVLGANQINKILTRLAQILEDAVEYGYIDRNPARGRRRRVKGTRPERLRVEPEQLQTLIESAGTRVRPVLATLAGAGLRIGEACALNWRDVNLATGSLTVRDAKTDAGSGRVIDLPIGLVEELGEWKARSPRTGPNDPVFTSEPRNGRAARQTKRNVEARLKTTIKDANKRLAELGIEPISERVTPHSLRRAYASLRFALGDDPVYVSEQLGHTKPTFSIEVYASAVKRRGRLSGAYLKEFDRALEWASQRAPVKAKGTGKGTETGTEAGFVVPAQEVGAVESAPQDDSGA